ncbi:MAG: hypothetical protein ACXWP5_04165, partial [Bdellovibrionota bacterium]
MKSSHLLSLALIVLPVAALASEGSSSGTRGGGNAVVCFDSPQVPAEIRSGTGELTDAALAHVTSVETYDLLEAKLPRGFQANAPEIIPLLEGEAPTGAGTSPPRMDATPCANWREGGAGLPRKRWVPPPGSDPRL